MNWCFKSKRRKNTSIHLQINSTTIVLKQSNLPRVRLEIFAVVVVVVVPESIAHCYFPIWLCGQFELVALWLLRKFTFVVWSVFFPSMMGCCHELLLLSVYVQKLTTNSICSTNNNNNSRIAIPVNLGCRRIFTVCHPQILYFHSSHHHRAGGRALSIQLIFLFLANKLNYIRITKHLPVCAHCKHTRTHTVSMVSGYADICVYSLTNCWRVFYVRVCVCVCS